MINSRKRLLGLLGTAAAVAVTSLPAPALASNAAAGGGGTCSPRATATRYTDALDKVVKDGVAVGGLSALTYDARSRAWATVLDNAGDADPSRIWFVDDLTTPVVTSELVLKNAAGVPYNGVSADNEGLAVLPNGDYLVSSENEPTIRIFGRDGRQKESLPVPARFAITGTTAAGEASDNEALEGLTVTPSGRRIVASMEGALSGDVSATGDATQHRFLIYDRAPDGRYRLTKQIAYRAEPGQRIAEVLAYRDDAVLVEEASFAAATGNEVSLFALTGLDRASDVSRVPNLSATPGLARPKVAVADLVNCPSLGAPAKQVQTNPLLDNYEGMALTTSPRPGSPCVSVTLISDDNFRATQITRLLQLELRLP